MATELERVTTARLSEELIAVRDRWHCKNHPFYDRLAEGRLDLRHLGTFLTQHYLHVAQVFRSIGVTYAKAPDDIARFILENLAEEAGMRGIDEDHEAHDHSELIFRFTRHCGLSDEQVKGAQMLPTWLARAALFWWVTDHEHPAIRMALQSTQESQLVGENAERVIPALTTHYGFTREAPEIHFFVEHAEADVKHGNIMFALVDKHCDTPQLRSRALEIAEQACRLRWVAFNELYRVTVLGEAVGQTPV